MTRTIVKLPREFPGGIRYSREEQDAVLRVVSNQSPFRYYGPACTFEARQFEEEFARFLASLPGQAWPESSPYFVTATNSGTGALEVALDALEIGCGDEVLVPGFMWISTISSVIRNRAVPVLVDADDTLNMDPEDIVRKMSDRTKAVLVVHMAGEAARIGGIMERIRAINAERINRKKAPVRVLEDCAQMIGGHARGIPGSVTPLCPEGVYRVGAFGDIGMFSLQLNKNITSGEGGIVVTRDPALHRRIQALHDVGFIRDSKGTGNIEGIEKQVLVWGQGRRFTEVQAALARVQLQRLDDILQCMRHSHRILESHVASKPGLSVRQHADNTGGDSGGFLLIQFKQPAGGEKAALDLGRLMASELRSRGLLAFYLHDYEVHIYYNILQLVNKQPIHVSGCPWSCPENEDHERLSYKQGALPELDSRLVRTVGVGITSLLTQEQEKAMLQIFNEVFDPAMKSG